MSEGELSPEPAAATGELALAHGRAGQAPPLRQVVWMEAKTDQHLSKFLSMALNL